jgi:uncharacterized repeat protein (TIGR01451 family)
VTKIGRLRLALALTIGLTPFLLWLSVNLVTRLPVARAADLTVCPAGPPDCQYTSIQAAVDAAADGDVIKVAAGTYTDVNTYGGTSQVVYITKTVTVRGGYTTTNWAVSDPDVYPTTLDALGRGRGVAIGGSPPPIGQIVPQANGPISPTIEGLRITGGNAYLLGGAPYGDDTGGGVYVHSATATIRDCVIYGNTASTSFIGGGGGVYLYDSVALLEGNTVQGNVASSGYDGYGGGVCLEQSLATLIDNRIISNTASTIEYGGGGGVYLYDSTATLTGNTVRDNVASSGLYSYGFGGGIYLESSTVELADNTVQGNAASTANSSLGIGGGIYLFSYRPVTLTGNTIISNTASTAYTGYGGGLSIEYTEATLIGNTVAGNIASDAYDGYGGGIGISSVEGNGELVTLEGNTVWNNVASTKDMGYGGGLYVEGNGAVLANNAVISNTATLSPTTAGEGGGVWIGYLYGASITMTNNLVAHNHATTAGSGLYFLGYGEGTAVRSLHNTISDNDATGSDGGQGVFVGGANATLAFSNTIISGHAGVGITVTAGSQAILEGTLWYANGLDAGGAGTIVSSADVYGDPAFADPASWDYHLTASSAAIDAGVDAGITTDFEGQGRPQGDGFDLGYDESPFTIQADVAIVKSVIPEIVASSQMVTYTLAFTNAGPHPALGVRIADAVPAVLTNVGYTSAGAALTPTGSFSYTWEVADLAPGQGGVITITGTVAPSVSGVFALVNQAEITTTRDDADPLNNTSTVSSTIDAEPPEPPALASPADGARTNDSTPTLTWSASPDSDVAGYLLDLDGSVTNLGDALAFTTALLTDGPHTWSVAAYDALGNTSAFAKPWSFTIDSVAPTIVSVTPTDGATDVEAATPIEIAFSEPIDPGAFAFAVTPDPGGWSVAWSAGNQVATLTHAPFAGGATQAANVTTARDSAGNSLARTPYTWSFTTVVHRSYLPLVLTDFVVAPDLVVKHITATESDVQVVIGNEGNATAMENFWVDVYIDPDPPPTHVNQTWPDLASAGLVWGVTADLAPGETLVLTVDGDYYSATYSDVTWPLAAGAAVYAQVDSYNTQNAYGGVLEIDEIRGATYNNIGHTTVVTADFGSLARPHTPDGRPPIPPANLPARPPVSPLPDRVQ